MSQVSIGGTRDGAASLGSGRNAGEQTLAMVLGEFARTLSTDFPVQQSSIISSNGSSRCCR